LAKYPQIHLFEDDQDRVGYLILNWNPEKWNLHAHKIMCTFYDFKGEKCRIHGVHPRTCQAYPFMKESSIIDRPNRRCPKLFIPDERDPEGISKILRFLEDELQVYREQCDKWNQRPNKQRKWKDLALYLRKTYV
jgi:Fe-S-cluster containining protein